MSNEAASWKPEIELGRNWPEQIIVDHAPYWRAWRRQAPEIEASSAREYDRIARHWIPFANGKDVKPQLLLAWSEYCRKLPSRYSKTGVLDLRTLGVYHRKVKSYLHWLHTVGALSIDPSGCMPFVRGPAPEPKLIFTHEEYQQMVKVASNGGAYVSLGVDWLIVLGYHTGLSLVDCATLKWEDVIIREDGPCFVKRIRRKMRSRQGTKATSMIPIIVGGELWVWFKRRERRRHENSERGEGIDYVHQDAAQAHTEGDGITLRTALSDLFKEALGEKRAGRSFRHLRNTFASRLINAGNDSLLVSKMTGHSRLDQLSDYVVPDQSAMQQAILRGLRHAEGTPPLPAHTVPPDEAAAQQPNSLASDDAGGTAINER